MTIRIPAGSRTLYIDLKQNADGSRFLDMTQVVTSRGGERSRIRVDEKFVADVHRALAAVLELMVHKTPPKAYSMGARRGKHARAYKLWTPEEENDLRERYSLGSGVDELAERHGRKPTAIISRMYQLGILRPTDKPRWD